MLNQLAPALQSQLVFDMGLVSFDGLYAAVQFLGYLARAAAFADQTEYLQLAVGKSGEAGIYVRGAPLMY